MQPSDPDHPLIAELYLLDEPDQSRVPRVVAHFKSTLRPNQCEGVPRITLQQAALDALAFGAIICDDRSGIVLVNAAADALARAGSGIVLGLRGHALCALKPCETKRLSRLIHDAARGRAGGVLRLTGQDGAPGLLVLVTPLRLDERYNDRYALVSLRSAQDRPAFSEETLAALFQLSPAQAEIALALYNGRTPDEIAAERGVRISTLRSHIAEILARTGTESQRELVRLLGLLPPLRQSPVM